MKKGYYTDVNNNVLGYFELQAIPEDTETFKYVESEDKPPIYVSNETIKNLRKLQIKFELNSNDLKVIRAISDGDAVRINEHKTKQQLLRDELSSL